MNFDCLGVSITVASDYVKGLVSLLLTCYNHEKFIGDAIESVLAQTYDNIEIIICDDFSTDHSWEIIQSFVPELQKRFHRKDLEAKSKTLWGNAVREEVEEKYERNYHRLMDEWDVDCLFIHPIKLSRWKM